jgi:tetratricopeptide (TPR) repeat protein
VNLGRLDQAEGSFDSALDHYTTALLSEPHNPIAHFNTGCVMERLDRTDAAILAYHEALTHDATLSEAHYRLAVLYEHEGRELDALRHLKHYRLLIRRH